MSLSYWWNLLRARSLQSYSPVAAIVDDHVWLTRRGDLFTVLRLRGIHSELMSELELQAATESYERARSRFDEDFIVYEYLHKQTATEIPAETEQAKERAKFLEQRDLATVSLHLVVLLRSGDVSARGIQKNSARLLARVATFEQQVATLLGPERLARQETYRFLRALANLDGQAKTGYLNGDVAPRILATNIDLDKGHFTLRQGRQRLSVLTMIQTNPRPSLDTFKALRDLPVNFILCTQSQRKAKPKFMGPLGIISRKRIFHYTNLFDLWSNLQQRLNKGADPAAARNDLLSSGQSESNIEQLQLADKFLTDEGNYFVDYRYTAVLYDHDEERLTRAKLDAIAAVEEKEAVFVEETLGCFWHYLAILPGHYGLNKRRKLIYPLGAACSGSPCYAVPTGSERNEHLGAEYLLALEASHSTLYYLNLHERDVLTALVVGAQGSGKTFFAQSAIEHYAKYGGPIFAMDTLGNFEPVMRLIGGSHTSLTAHTQFNPFLCDPDPANVAALETLAAMWITHNGKYLMTQDEEDEVRSAIWNTLANEPRLSAFTRALTGRMRKRMEAWQGSMFDGATDALGSGKYLSFDFGHLLGDERLLTPAVFYITHAMNRRARDYSILRQPKLIVADEVFLLAKNSALGAYFIEFAKTARNFNGGIVLMSQSALDFDKLGARELVFETFKTHLIFPTERMHPQAYRERFGLNEKEAQAAAGMQAKRQFLLRKGDEPAVILNFEVPPETHDRYSTNPYQRKREAVA